MLTSLVASYQEASYIIIRRKKYHQQIMNIIVDAHDFDLEKLIDVLAPENIKVFTTLASELIDHGLLYFDEFGKIRGSKKNNSKREE